MKNLTMQMFESNAPLRNPYQGDDKRVLFVCSAGILRSATAARLYAPKYNTRCAGSTIYALIPVTADLLVWADEVVFVNPENHKNIAQQFDLNSYEGVIKILDIPDRYPHMAPELINLFKTQYEDI